MDIHVYNNQILGKHVIQTNPPKFDESLFSEIYLCRERERERERGRERERERESKNKNKNKN